METKTLLLDNKEAFAVVNFSDGLQVIPVKWILDLGRNCAYPNTNNNAAVKKAAMQKVNPKDDWLKYAIIKIYGTYETYEIANKKCKEAEDTSDLNSDIDNKVKRRTKAKKDYSEYVTMEYDKPANYKKKLPVAQNSKRPRIEIPLPIVPPALQSKISNANQTFAANDSRSKSKENESSILNFGQFPNDFQVMMPITNSDDDDAESLTQSDDLEDTEFQNSLINEEEDNSSETHQTSQISREVVEYMDVNVQSKFLKNRSLIYLKNKKPGTVFTIFNEKSDETEEVAAELSDEVFNLKRLVTACCELIETLIKSDGSESQASHHALIQTNFPLDTFEKVQSFEENLKKDKLKRNQLQAYMTIEAGTNFKNMILKLLRNIFDDEVISNHFTWAGKKTKSAFRDLQVCKHISDAVLKKFPGTTNSDINQTMEYWIKNARSRLS